MPAQPNDKSFVRGSEPKKRRLYAFTFFLVLSSLLWLSVKLAGSYTISIKVRLKLTQPPIEYFINERQAKPEINILITAKGFSLLRFYTSSFNNNPIIVPIDKIHSHRQNQNTFYITAANLRAHIASELGLIENQLVLSDGDLIFNMEPLVEKKTAVNAVYELHFDSQYKLYEKVKLEPDSILVLAPQSVFDTLKYIDTELIKKSKLNESFEMEVALVQNPLLKPRQETVKASFTIERFTELSADIKISKPVATKIKLFPSTARIIFSVAMKDYHKINPEQFIIEVDTSGIGTRNKFLSISLIQFPQNIEVNRIEPEQVEYIIPK